MNRLYRINFAEDALKVNEKFKNNFYTDNSWQIKKGVFSHYAKQILKIEVSRYYGIPIDNLKIVRNLFGKPYFEGYSFIEFNFSYSGNELLIGISNKCIGVDLEQKDYADEKIAQRFFVKPEMDYVFQDVLSIKCRCIEIWTKKEAYLKYLGVGMYMPMRSFNVLEGHYMKILKTIKIENTYISICSQVNLEEFVFIDVNVKNVKLFL